MVENKVARDGIEPPTRAFSGLLTDSSKWFRIKWKFMANIDFPLRSFGIIWDGLGWLRLLDVPVLFPGPDSDPVAERGSNQGPFRSPSEYYRFDARKHSS